MELKFGQFAGIEIKEIPTWYLKWIAEKEWLWQEAKVAIANVLIDREIEDQQLTNTSPSTVKKVIGDLANELRSASKTLKRLQSLNLKPDVE